ncbi:MAG: CDP-alcohol phosphatidyltransferase family protein [Candidatus Sericytochromatia bacterium]
MFIGVYNIPNAITLTGLMLSLMSCFLSYNNKIELAIICFMYSGICDMFDGMIARKMSLNEEAQLFGVQLDSIVDIVSFGVAPVMITFHLGFNSLIDYILLIFYTCCATMRLAYFNIHGTSGDGKIKYYTGLPVTFSAMIFPLAYITIMSGNESLYYSLIRTTFFTVAVMFILNIKIPKPGGIFYVLSPIVALFLTYFWLTH